MSALSQSDLQDICVCWFKWWDWSCSFPSNKLGFHGSYLLGVFFSLLSFSLSSHHWLLPCFKGSHLAQIPSGVHVSLSPMAGPDFPSSAPVAPHICSAMSLFLCTFQYPGLNLDFLSYTKVMKISCKSNLLGKVKPGGSHPLLVLLPLK